MIFVRTVRWTTRMWMLSDENDVPRGSRRRSLSLEDAKSLPTLRRTRWGVSEPSRSWSADRWTYVHEVPDDERPALLRRPRLLLFEQVEFATKGEEVGEERVEVALGGQVQEDGVVRVVEVREDAQELRVDVARNRRKVRREFAAWDQPRASVSVAAQGRVRTSRAHQLLWGRRIRP